MLLMRVTASDIFSPANVVTLVGFGMTTYGSMHLQTPEGFWLVTAGRFLDVLDGPVARRTHTSRLGAVLDATVDKLTVLAITLGLLAFDAAPLGVVGYILLQNILVSAMNLVSAQRKVAVSTTRSGKLNIFMQMCTMIAFAGAALIHGSPHTLMTALGWVCLLVSLPFALKSTIQYAQHLPVGNQRRSGS